MTLLDRLNAEGYVRCIRLPTGAIAGIMPQLYTVGLFVGLTETGYSRRYCYETKQQAVEALDAWDGNGDPPGPWIKEKPSDRLGPGATKPPLEVTEEHREQGATDLQRAYPERQP